MADVPKPAVLPEAKSAAGAAPEAAKFPQKIGEMNVDKNGMDIDAAAAIEAKRAAEKKAKP